MNYWKVYYYEGRTVKTDYACSPESWSLERVQRTMRTMPGINGTVLVEPAEKVENPQFNLKTT